MRDVWEAKRRLREIMRARQRVLPESYIRAAGENIQGRILASAAYHDAGHLFLYVSLPTEPGTRRIIRQALADGKKVYVPCCVGKDMLAVRIADMDALVPGAFGIPEPRIRTETASAKGLDLILVPCLAASPDGRRLGHGGGYYDRFLKEQHEKAVCLCFRRMLCADIPITEEDVLIPRIVSEAENLNL